MDIIKKEKIEKIVRKWQATLRLQDWDISLKIIRRKWRKSGDIKIDMEDRLAVLMINHKPKCENMEELVLHELLHLKLWGMDQINEDLLSCLYGERDSKKKEFAYAQYMRLLESTVQDLTNSFLLTAKCKKPVSLNRLKALIEHEEII